jgi:diguanylate cyclase (GGDEF)-like protein
MSQAKTLTIFKVTVAILGGVFFASSIFNLDSRVLDYRFICFILFTLIIASKLNLRLPHSKFVICFSDSMVFLAFLLFGGNEAVFIATIEMLSNCLYLKYKGLDFARFTIPFNIGATASSTTLTFFSWAIFIKLTVFEPNFYNSKNLVIALGFLALVQFFTSSIFGSIFYGLKTKTSFWQAWKEEYFSTSITQFAGAGLAGVIFWFVSFGDYLVITISLIVFSIIYLSYRHSMTKMTKSIEKAEQAERDKAEAERNRAEQAEKHAAELAELLKKEEKTSEALRISKEAFEHSAMHDALTNLANRANLTGALTDLIQGCKQNTSKCFCILFLDISRFKNINDSLGHTIGDKVLVIVAKRLQRLVREKDVVARLGGDEFAVILNDLPSVEIAEGIAQKIHDKISEPLSLSGNSIFIDLNIGIAPFELEYETPEEILRDADIAMHYAKETGSGVAVFDKELRARFLDKITLESDLRFAIERNELSMHYQPLISLKDGGLMGFEALLRWHHEKRGFISPAQFIPIAEDSGLIIPITSWILDQTCNQLAKWQQLSPSYNDLIVSVNISGKHLAKESLLDDVKSSLKTSRVAPQALKLEITESTAMENAEYTIRLLNRLKEIGVQLSIDDFGTGYSSLSYLHRLPFDTLKIDRSFVYSVGENGENSEVLQTIISLAKNLKMRVIAEGIETENQLSLLQNLGCDFGQGYLMSKPLPAEEMEKLLYQKRNWLPAVIESDETEKVSKEVSKEKSLPVF